MYRHDLRAPIVDAFIEEFNLHGPKLTLDDVASRLRISKKTIYRFFRGKSDIYDYILSDAAQSIQTKQKEIYEDESLSTLEKLERILTIKTAWEDKIDIAKMDSLQKDCPEIYTHVLKAYENGWDYVGKLLEEAKGEGLVKQEIATPLLIAYLRSAMEALYDTEVLRQSHLTYTQAINELALLVLHGILR